MTYKYVCRVQNVDDETGKVQVVGYHCANKCATKYVEHSNDVSLWHGGSYFTYPSVEYAVYTSPGTVFSKKIKILVLVSNITVSIMLKFERMTFLFILMC